VPSFVNEPQESNIFNSQFRFPYSKFNIETFVNYVIQKMTFLYPPPSCQKLFLYFQPPSSLGGRPQIMSRFRRKGVVIGKFEMDRGHFFDVIY